MDWAHGTRGTCRSGKAARTSGLPCSASQNQRPRGGRSSEVLPSLPSPRSLLPDLSQISRASQAQKARVRPQGLVSRGLGRSFRALVPEMGPGLKCLFSRLTPPPSSPCAAPQDTLFTSPFTPASYKGCEGLSQWKTKRSDTKRNLLAPIPGAGSGV